MDIPLEEKGNKIEEQKKMDCFQIRNTESTSRPLGKACR